MKHLARGAAAVTLGALLSTACGGGDTAVVSVTDDLGVPASEAGPDTRVAPSAASAVPAPGDPINAANPGDPGSMTPPPPPLGGSSGGGPVPVLVGVTLGAPGSIVMGSQSILQGNLTFTKVTAYTRPQGNLQALDMLGGQPIVVPMSYGSSAQTSLFDVPQGTVVVHLVGYFDPTSPDLAPVPFDITAFGSLDTASYLQLYLPTSTSTACAQVTGLGGSSSLSDNTDIFTASAPTGRNIADILDPTNPGMIDPGSAPLSTLPSCASSGQMQRYTTLRGGGTAGLASCSAAQISGSDAPVTQIVELGARSGTVQLDYDTASQQDQIIVYYENQAIFDSGCVGTNGTRTQMLSFSGASTRMVVDVFPNCAGGSGTSWNFTLHCPN